jgi:hypothetical protein
LENGKGSGKVIINVKEINVIIRIVSLILFIIGLWVLIQSTEIGSGSAGKFLSKNGGSMDTASFLIIKESYINTYRYLGTILLLVGGLSVLRKWE